MSFIKKLDIGGIKKIDAYDIQNAFFNETLEDEYKEQAKLKHKTNKRERLAKFLVNESEGPNFQKVYNMFLRMTEEEFSMMENALRGKEVYMEADDSTLHDRIKTEAVKNGIKGSKAEILTVITVRIFNNLLANERTYESLTNDKAKKILKKTNEIIDKTLKAD